MRQLDQMPESSRSKKELTIPQLRVLTVLAKSKGPLTRGKISDRIGNKTQVVAGRAIGYSDPAKRASFENTKDGGFRPSLLTLGYVLERELNIDGLSETALEITPAGREILGKHKQVKLPPLRIRKGKDEEE